MQDRVERYSGWGGGGGGERKCDGLLLYWQILLKLKN